jgi:hypothetical protein
MHSRKPVTDTDHLINRLKTNWAALLNNPIVSGASAMSTESFESAKNQLASTLQLALYLSPPERKMLQAICSIRDADPRAFGEYIRATSQLHLALITDGHTIARALGVENMVEIRWNKSSQTVSVLSVRGPRPPMETRSYSKAVASTPTAIMPRKEQPAPVPVSAPTPALVPVSPTPAPSPVPEPVVLKRESAKGRRERPRGGKKMQDKKPSPAAIPLMSATLQDQVIASLSSLSQPPKEETGINTDLRNTSWDQ